MPQRSTRWRSIGISPARGRERPGCAGGGHCAAPPGQNGFSTSTAQHKRLLLQNSTIRSQTAQKNLFLFSSVAEAAMAPALLAWCSHTSWTPASRHGPGQLLPRSLALQKAQGAALPRLSPAWQPRGWLERCFVVPLLLAKPPQEVFGFWARPADEEGVHSSRAGQGRAGCMCSLLLTRRAQCRAVHRFHQTFCVMAAADTGPLSQ